jgi:hypothetical protein
MKKYKIRYHEMRKQWDVVYGTDHILKFYVEEVVFSSKRISDCYAWLKAKNEGLLIE